MKIKKITSTVKNGLFFGMSCLTIIFITTFFSTQFPEIHQYGIAPREPTIRSLMGIFLAPLIHGGWSHLVSNAIPLFLLSTTLMMFYRKVAINVVVFSIIIGGCLVWILGRGDSVHYGASGLVLALIGFLIFNVFFRRDWKSLAIALIVGFFYGTCILGILPGDSGISWESHLFGFLAGILLAYSYRKVPSA